LSALPPCFPCKFFCAPNLWLPQIPGFYGCLQMLSARPQ
jgi:hypothetical protein